MALKIDKNDKKKQSENLSYVGQALYYQGRLEDALQSFDKAIKFDKEIPTHLYYRALVKQKINKVEEAVDDFGKSIDKGLSESSQLWNALYNRGICLRQLNRLKEAIIDFKKAVEFQPDKSNGYD